MKKALLIFLVPALFFTTMIIADEPEVVRQARIKLMLDGDAQTFDVSDLLEGEAREFFIGDNSVVITNNGGSFGIEVNGEELDTGSGHRRVMVRKHIEVECDGEPCETEDVHRIVINGDASEVDLEGLGIDIDIESGDLSGLMAEGASVIFIGEDGEVHAGDGEGVEWHTLGDGGEKVIHVQRHGALQHLLDSGVLDEVDEATRQKIIDTLKEATHHKSGAKVIVRTDKDS